MNFPAFLTPTEIKVLQIQESRSKKIKKRTPEQLEAIYTNNNNVLVSASAGSGKTFVIVERIVDKIMRGIKIDEMFVATFTTKSAGELKERLEKRLNEVLKITDNLTLKQHLTYQISNIQNADIGTMDSFTKKLVITHGYLLGVSSKFRILNDRSEQEILENEIFAKLFDQYFSKNRKSQFQTLIENFSENSQNTKYFRTLVSTIYQFIQTTSQPKQWMESTFLKSYLEYDFDNEFQNFSEITIKPLLLEVQSFFREHLDRSSSQFRKANYLKNIEFVLQNLETLSTETPSDELVQMLDFIYAVSRESNGKAFINTTRKPDLKSEKDAYNEIQRTLMNRIQEAHQIKFELETLNSYQSGVLPILELLKEFILNFTQNYRKKKIEESIFEFSDINHFAIEILEKYSHIRQLYQNQYHEVMVDEYQDTSHTHEKLLDLLSNGRNRFMVGDIKQSIYAFRQADPQIFNQKLKDFQENSSKGKVILLTKNFRSQCEVLHTINSIFGHLMDEQIGDIHYDTNHQLVAGSKKQKQENTALKTEFFIYNTDISSEKSDQSINQNIGFDEVKLVIKEIIKLYQTGVPFDQIALLVPSRTRNNIILEIFDQHGIPIVSDGNEQQYLKSLEVMVMIDTLRTINNPLNDYALVALLKSPMFSFNEDELARISLQKKDKNQPQNFYEKMENSLIRSSQYSYLIDANQLNKIKHFMDVLKNWRSFSKSNSLYDLIWKIYNDKFYYDYVGSLPRGKQRQENLYNLSLYANRFERSQFKGLPRFISMLDKSLKSKNNLDTTTISPLKNSVNLMTIHQSKGLEFPYVFLLNMDQTFHIPDTKLPFILNREEGIGIKYLADMKKDFPNTFLPKVSVIMETIPYKKNKKAMKIANLSERMRLLYVAMTRAKKKLYLVGRGSKNKLDKRYGNKEEKGLVPFQLREKCTSFQDWVLAIESIFKNENLYFNKIFVEDDDLDPNIIDHINNPFPIQVDNLSNNRQTEEIQHALDILENVEKINTKYLSAINLPTVQTPSQIKKNYEPIMNDDESIYIMNPLPLKQLNLEFPNFLDPEHYSINTLGSATHELMQRISLDKKPDRQSIETTIAKINAPQSTRKNIDVEKILFFFDTELGKIIVKNQKQLRREAPFSMLKKDKTSGETFMVRGIIDGFIQLSDRIILFDYKTEPFKNPLKLKIKYQEQMELYSEALRRSYQIEQVDKYLVLLGGKHIQILPI